jgi:hypothetical protein
MSFSSDLLRQALDPAYAAEVRSRPQPSEESTKALAEALIASTRRLERKFARELCEAKILAASPRPAFAWWPLFFGRTT